MKKTIKNWKDYHHQLYQIYHGTIALTLTPFAFFFLEWESSDNSSISTNSTSFIIVSQLLWAVGYASWYAWKSKKVKYQKEESTNITSKMDEFKKRNIIKYLSLGVAGGISVIAMWLVPSSIFALTYFAVLVQYSFLRPSEAKFVRDMGLTKEDQKALHDES